MKRQGNGRLKVDSIANHTSDTDRIKSTIFGSKKYVVIILTNKSRIYPWIKLLLSVDIYARVTWSISRVMILIFWDYELKKRPLIWVASRARTGAQLVKFPIDVSFGSIFEPVEISQKFNFLPTDYDYRNFLKAYRIHRGMNHSNAILKKFLTAKSISIKYNFSCREQFIYAMNML